MNRLNCPTPSLPLSSYFLGPMRFLAWTVITALTALSCAGAKPPQISLNSVESVKVQNLSSQTKYLGKSPDKKAHLIHFFATWCFTCLPETATLNALYGELSECGFQVTGVGFDLEGARVLAPFVAAEDIAYPVVMPSNEMRSGHTPFGPIRVLPQSFLFDANGQLIASWEGPAERSALRQVILQTLGNTCDRPITHP